MAVFLGGLLLFLVLFLLVFIFHLFVWNFQGGLHQSSLRSWVDSFECGFSGQGVTESTFSFTYFILLVFFVVFDLEISLLLNLPLQGVLYKNLSYYLFFVFILCFGFGAEIYKGYVSWAY